MPKLNASGQYTRYPGVTVIAAVLEKDNDLWSDIRECLTSSSASEYFAFTPVTSYHMTVFNLFTERGVGKLKWNSFIKNNLGYFEALSHALSSQEEINFRVTNIIVTNGGTINLLVEPSAEQISDYINIAKAYGAEEGIPVFHITLGHCFKLMKPAVEAQVKAQLKTELASIFKYHAEPLKVAAPKLCSFQDMTKFKPWNGKTDPFHQVNSGFAQGFFNSVLKALTGDSGGKKLDSTSSTMISEASP